MSIKSILVPLDFEDPSLHALAYALKLAEKIGALVHLVHAYEPVVVPTSTGRGVIPYQRLHQEAIAALEQAAARHHASPVLGRRVAMMGDPKTVILQATEELGIDLLVLGSHGRRGIKRLLLGSVSEPVMREVACPVLVTRHGQPAAVGG